MGKKRLNKKQGLSFEVICLGAALCVVLGVFLLVNQNKGLQKSSLGVSQTAEAAHSTSSGQAVYGLPKPTQLISTSKIHSSPVLKGIKIDPNDPFKLEFIIDTEDEEDVSEEEVRRLVEYFLAALTIPEEDLWVNLSPYEENKIIPKNLSHTELGKDLLGEDYVLKQLVSSLTYPESKLGRKYWNKVYEEVRKIAGTTNLHRHV